MTLHLPGVTTGKGAGDQLLVLTLSKLPPCSESQFLHLKTRESFP